MLREVTRKAKFQLLAQDMGDDPMRAAGCLELLWHLTADSYPDGAIGRLSDEELECLLRWKLEPGTMIPMLVKRRWLDKVPGEARLYVHDWHHHADATVQRKLARSRSFFANGEPPKTGTLDKPERAAADAWYSKNTPEQPAGSPRVTRGLTQESLQGQGQGQGQGQVEEPPVGTPACAGAPAVEAEPAEKLGPWVPYPPTSDEIEAAARERDSDPQPKLIQSKLNRGPSQIGQVAAGIWHRVYLDVRRVKPVLIPRAAGNLKRHAEQMRKAMPETWAEELESQLRLYFADDDRVVIEAGWTVDVFIRRWEGYRSKLLQRAAAEAREHERRSHPPPKVTAEAAEVLRKAGL